MSSPELDVTPRAAGPGSYFAPRWLNVLTEHLRHAAFTVLYLVPTLWLVNYKLIWHDEFFTMYLARANWRSLLAALATGADQHPPSFYYLTHWIFQLFGMSHITCGCRRSSASGCSASACMRSCAD